jgi:hypothetical protein
VPRRTSPPFFTAQAAALDRHLLSIHHHEAILSAPALRLAARRSLITAAGQGFDFLCHRQQDQLQSRLAN